jgi:hypothetical protein
MSSATAPEPVQQHAQETSTVPSIQEAPGPLASASWQTSVQAAGAAPVATIVWPDPPAVPTVKAQKPYLVLSDAGADTVFPTVDVRAPDDSEGAAKGGASTTDVPWVEDSPAATFVEILLVVAFGLTLAGLLYRVAMKIAARRGRRAIFDHSKSGWMDDRHQREWRDDRQDDLYPSLVSAAGDYSARCPLRADDECQNNARRKNSASVTDEVSRRESTLQQLILDLDQMLQSRKWRSGAGGHFSHLRP